VSIVDEDRAFREAAELEAVGHLRELALIWHVPTERIDYTGAEMRRTLERYRTIWEAALAYDESAITTPPPRGYDPENG
jgi:hypothetical protein